jgi:hypothetical protein
MIRSTNLSNLIQLICDLLLFPYLETLTNVDMYSSPKHRNFNPSQSRLDSSHLPFPKIHPALRLNFVYGFSFFVLCHFVWSATKDNRFFKFCSGIWRFRLLILTRCSHLACFEHSTRLLQLPCFDYKQI